MTQFIITLELTKGKTWPTVQFDPPSEIINTSRVTDDIQLVEHRVCVVNNSIDLHYVEKTSSETIVDSEGNILKDQAVEIKSIHADEIKLDFKIIDQFAKFFPNYRTDFHIYCADNNIALPTGPLSTKKFWHAGHWKLEFLGNFWIWYARVRASHVASLDSESDLTNYFGQSGDQLLGNLNKLKKLLL